MLTAYHYRPVLPQEYELVRQFLIQNGWAHRVADPQQFEKMMQSTDETIAVWYGNGIVGFGRALSDGVSNGYLSMVVVAEVARGQGVGREIVQRLIGDNPEITWVLRAGRGSEGFWSRMGFTASEVVMERRRQER